MLIVEYRPASEPVRNMQRHITFSNTIFSQDYFNKHPRSLRGILINAKGIF